MIKESQARARAYSSGLLATDPRLNQAAQVLHVDGSLFRIQSAFVMRDPKDPKWLWLITEHFGEMVFDNEDIESVEEQQIWESLSNW